jgi:hypothetical protein
MTALVQVESEKHCCPPLPDVSLCAFEERRLRDVVHCILYGKWLWQSKDNHLSKH